MPILLLFVGLLLLVAAYNDTYACLFTVVKQDVTIQFGAWVIAVILIGAVGYIKKLEPISNAALALIIVVLFLSKQGVWTQLTQAVQTIGASSTSTPIVTSPVSSGTNQLGGIVPVIPAYAGTGSSAYANTGLPTSGSDTSGVASYGLSSGEALLSGTGIGASDNQDFVSSTEDSINQDFSG